MNDFITHVDLNTLPLSYNDMLIGMDWLEKHKVMLNCFDKTFTCIDNTGNTIKIKVIPKRATIREIYALQIKIIVSKGCKVFVVYVMEDKNNENKLKIEDMPILKDFEYILPRRSPSTSFEKRYWHHDQSNTRSGTSIERSLPNEHNRDYKTQITIIRIDL